MNTTPLRKRTIDTLKIGHYSERTITTYIDWLIRLARHYHRSPDQLTDEQVQDFLLYLIEERKLAWSTVNQAHLNPRNHHCLANTEKNKKKIMEPHTAHPYNPHN